MKLCYTIEEAAGMLRVDRKTVLRAIERKDIQATRIGRVRRISAREMCRLLGIDEGEVINEG